MKKVLNAYFKTNLLLKIIIALILGAICGVLFQGTRGDSLAVHIFSPLGEIFIRLLKMIVLPVIISSLIVGTSSISPASLGKVGLKIVIFYLFTSMCAIVIGLIVGIVFAPGEGLSLVSQNSVAKSANAPSAISILLNIIPTNPFSAIAKGEVLPCIFFAVCFGIALAFCKDSDDTPIKDGASVVFKFFEGFSEAMFKIVSWVMQYAPIGVFALIFIVFTKNGKDALLDMGRTSMNVVGDIMGAIAVSKSENKLDISKWRS